MLISRVMQIVTSILCGSQARIVSAQLDDSVPIRYIAL